ncbi:MAG: ComF family protein [Planctomycetia bacterium]|nr:ComF family protein [Planctomycetia bacterium]
MIRSPKNRWRLPAWARAFARGAADFVYPPACRLCTADLAEREPGCADRAPFCDSCRAELLATRGPACVKCGASIGPYLDPNVPCSFCRNENYAFERVYRLGVYDTALRTACLRSKSSGAEPLTAGLADLMWECEGAELSEARIDVVAPVPHHWFRRFYSPHNPAATLGAAWAGRLKVPQATHILRKCRWTRPQARLLPYERRQNLRNAFQALPAAGLSGAVVLLADDVMTTGATAHEISKVLLQAGAARVVVGVIARGLGRR